MLRSRLGVVVAAERHHIDVDDAFQLVRGFWRSTNRLLVDAAKGVIDGTLTDELRPDVQPAPRNP